MKDTVFVNCTGLPAAGHHSSAYDIALMSRELILNHPDIPPLHHTLDGLSAGRRIPAGQTRNKLIRYYERRHWPENRLHRFGSLLSFRHRRA